MTQTIFVRVNTEYSECDVFGDLVTAMIYGSDIKPEHWQLDKDDEAGRRWSLPHEETFIVEREVPLSQGLPEPGMATLDGGEPADKFITQLDFVSSHRTGRLNGVDVADIIKVLGFMPVTGNDKSAYDFMFAVTCGGVRYECAIWDYKGSYRQNQWSCYGDEQAFRYLFPKAYTHEG